MLGILLVTSEWSQRTAMVSFTLTPARTGSWSQRWSAGLLAGLGSLASTVAAAALATVAGGRTTPGRPSGPTTPASSSVLQGTGVLQGLAFRPAVPELLGRDRELLRAAHRAQHRWPALAPLREVQPWIDLWSSQLPLFTGGDISPGSSGSTSVTSTVIWVVLPFAVGLTRVLRAEIKKQARSCAFIRART